MRTIFFRSLILLFCLSRTTAPGFKPLLVVWDIGQGLWATVITDRSCHHFDIGGEKTKPPVANWCSHKINKLYISHGDEDHIKFASWAASRWAKFCMAAPPLDRLSDRKKKHLEAIAACATGAIDDIEIREITTLPAAGAARGHNELSRVFVVNSPDGSILLPGDSTAEAEALWSQKLRPNDHIKYLVLGHHGSRTSTGQALLSHLPELTTAIASARKAKYGHPHAEVVERLRTRAVSVLSTETYGHIAIRF